MYNFAFVGCILWLRNGPECFTAMLGIFAILWKAMEIVGRRCVWMWLWECTARMFHAILYRLKRNLECLNPYITKHSTTHQRTPTHYIFVNEQYNFSFDSNMRYITALHFWQCPTRNQAFFNGNRIVFFFIQAFWAFFTTIFTYNFICQTFKSIVFCLRCLFFVICYTSPYSITWNPRHNENNS